MPDVIEQSVGDWDTDDKSTMMIQISAIAINYDLVVLASQWITILLKYCIVLKSTENNTWHLHYLHPTRGLLLLQAAQVE
jgi:hypothetical protein